jgi:hypothetical protein
MNGNALNGNVCSMSHRNVLLQSVAGQILSEISLPTSVVEIKALLNSKKP